jgi:SAM-dependent methyltransferase
MNITREVEILDVGCGLRKDGTINIDLNRNVKPDIVCDMLFLPFRKETFDKVISSAVVEHTIEPGLLVRSCYEVLKLGGIIEVTFPNYASFTVLLDWLTKKPSFSKSLILGDPTSPYLRHRGLHTVPTVEKLLLDHCFRIEKVIGHSPSVGPKFLRSIGSLLVRLFPQRAGNVTIIAKKTGEIMPKCFKGNLPMKC